VNRRPLSGRSRIARSSITAEKAARLSFYRSCFRYRDAFTCSGNRQLEINVGNPAEVHTKMRLTCGDIPAEVTRAKYSPGGSRSNTKGPYAVGCLLVVKSGRIVY